MALKLGVEHHKWFLRKLGQLDRLRTERKMTVLLLCHTRVRPFRNPEGPDYDRYQPDVHEKTWGLSHKWADCVLFGNFETTVQVDKADAKKGKGTGGACRLMYTERHAAYDAKNRLGLAPEIEMGSSPAEAWANFLGAIKAGRVWTNCYHQYPAGAAFGGYKASGVGRENHRMMLDHYTQTKCLLVSYDPEPVGLF